MLRFGQLTWRRQSCRSKRLYSSIQQATTQEQQSHIKPTNNPSIFTTLFPRTAALTAPSVIMSVAQLPESKQMLGVAPSNALSKALFTERMASIHAHIQNNDMFKAEVIFHNLYRTNMADLGRFVSTNLFNAFINGFLQSENPSASPTPVQMHRATEWYNRITDLKYSPNRETFALMVGAFCKLQSLEKINDYVSKMVEYSVDPVSVLHHDYFKKQPALASIYEAVLRKRDYMIEGAQVVDDVLLSVMKETSASTAATKKAVSKLSRAETLVKERFMLTAEELERVEVTKSIGVSLLSNVLQKLVRSSSDNPLSKYEQQEWLEEDCARLSLEQEVESESGIPGTMKGIRSVNNKMALQWVGLLTQRIADEIKTASAIKTTSTKHHGLERKMSDSEMFALLLRPLPPNQIALIILGEFMRVPTRNRKSEATNNNFVGEFKAVSLLTSIGKLVSIECIAKSLKSKGNLEYTKNNKKMHNLFQEGQLFSEASRSAASKVERTNAKLLREENWIPEWSIEMQARIGALLANMMIEVAKIPVIKELIQPDGSYKTETIMEPAFFHNIEVQQNKKMKVLGIIRYHPQFLSDVIRNSAESSTPPRLLPMIVPPKPWLSYESGGYLTFTSAQPLIRFNGNKEMKDLVRFADENGDLATLFYGLDVLGATPWRINRKILPIVLECWNDGKEWPSIASNEIISEEPSPIVQIASSDKLALREYYFSKRKKANAEKSRYSQRCDANYKVLLAKAFEHETIYFPHYIDFRGRAYPLPVHLNHIGNDLCRGLLQFNDAKPLGDDGIRWLKIQTANLFGKDKISFTERVDFVEANLEKVFACADNPLGGDRWWLEADDPWQFLATCIELTEALRSPNPQEHMSRLPIHQDGTCNGLQHYAALGGDLEGAKQVNLFPSESPGDVYSGIAEKVSGFIRKDALEGHPEALLLDGKITRKIVKQTVMTNTYGVTLIGAREQVRARLLDVQVEHGFTDAQILQCAPYITRLIFQSLENLFTGAQKIQKWLSTSARMISKSVHPKSLNNTNSFWLEDSDFLLNIGGDFIRQQIKLGINGEFHQLSRAVSNIKATSVLDDDLSFTISGQERLLLDDLKDGDPMDEVLDAAKKEKIDDQIASRNLHVFEFQGKHEADEADKSKLPRRNASVTWTTPIGLPVVQPYRSFKTKMIKTCMQNLSLKDHNAPLEVDSMKQAAAFPPNFVHSLDASHMIISAIKCKKRGLTFASVHDSYWCHASDVNTMGNLLREAFVELHSKNIMAELKAEFEHRNRGHKYPIEVILSEEMKVAFRQRLVDTGRIKANSRRKIRKSYIIWIDLELPLLSERGIFDIEMVKNSKYFFH